MSVPALARAAVLALCMPLAANTAERPPPDYRPWPEADALFSGDRYWRGGDGATSIDLGRGRVLWLFGDSWVDAGGSGRRAQTKMVANTVAIQHGYDPSTAKIRFYWQTGLDRKAAAFFTAAQPGKLWPGHGLLLDGKLTLFFMVVRPADNGLGFEIREWLALRIANPQAAPDRWRMAWLPTPAAAGRVIVGSASVLRVGDFVYAFSADESGRTAGHPAYLARWPVQAFARGELSGLQWSAGGGRWVDAGNSGEAQPVLADAQTEFSVHYDAGNGAYRLVQSSGFGQARIITKTAGALAGPWQEAAELFDPPENAFPKVMIYQAKAHPHLTGADSIITYSTNSFDFEDHLKQPWLYFPKFIRAENK